MATTLTQASLASSSVLARCGTSYAPGPLDETSLVEVPMQSISGDDFRLLVPGPAHLPVPLVDADAFREGACAGYAYGAEWVRMKTAVAVANLVCWSLFWNISHGESYEWTVGLTLGGFALLAEEDRQLALVGIAHLCFLARLVPDCTHRDVRAIHEARAIHNAAINAYQASVQALREQGQRLSDIYVGRTAFQERI